MDRFESLNRENGAEVEASQLDAAALRRLWQKEMLQDPRACIAEMIGVAKRSPDAFPDIFGADGDFVERAERVVQMPGYRGTDILEFAGTLPFSDADWVRSIASKLAATPEGQLIPFPQKKDTPDLEQKSA